MFLFLIPPRVSSIAYVIQQFFPWRNRPEVTGNAVCSKNSASESTKCLPTPADTGGLWENPSSSLPPSCSAHTSLPTLYAYMSHLAPTHTAPLKSSVSSRQQEAPSLWAAPVLSLATQFYQLLVSKMSKGPIPN